jgi:hypothetical protein
MRMLRVTDNHHSESAQSALAADSLGLGRSLDLWSMAFAVLAGAAMLMASQAHDIKPSLFLTGSVAVALLQKYYALRTRLDAAIFHRWALDWRSAGGITPAEDMAALDRALGKWSASVRTLSDRIRGARSLILGQIVCFILQTICFLAGVWLSR